MTNKTTTSASGRNLFLNRVIDAPREKVFKAWTDAELLKKWFAPLPYTTSHAELDVRAGGSNTIVMCSPDGQEMPNHGVYLEVVPNERIVVTDAYTKAWEPAENPFMTLILKFDDLGDKTGYRVEIRHHTEADREAHEKMGFHGGWPVRAEQLATLVEQR